MGVIDQFRNKIKAERAAMKAKSNAVVIMSCLCKDCYERAINKALKGKMTKKTDFCNDCQKAVRKKLKELGL